MLSIDQFSAKHLGQCALGDVFVGSQYVLGSIGIVAQSGDHRGTIYFGPVVERGFNFVPDGGGDVSLLVVKDVRFEIDYTSATSPTKSDYANGMIALQEGRPVLVCTYGHYPLFLNLDGTASEKMAADFMFKSWRLVCGPKEQPVELFNSSILQP